MAPAAAPAVVPVEAVTPPVITYGQPENSFWGDAATFAGGAVVGGLLGWGLTEAFDDDDDNDGFDDDDWDNEDVQEALRERREYSEERREDVVAARDERRDDRQGTGEDRAARARQQLNERPQAVGGRTRPAAAAAGKPRASQARAERGRRDVRLPGGGTQAGVQDKVRKRSAAVQPAQATGKPSATRLPSSQQKRAQASAGYAATRDHQGIAASAGSRQEVRSESDRGARSRVAQVGGGQSRATPAAVSRGGGDRVVARADRGGGGIAADRNRGAVAAADGARGRASRGGGGGGGGAGGGGGGGGGGLRNR